MIFLPFPRPPSQAARAVGAHTQPLLITGAVAYPQPRTMLGRSYIYVEAYKEAHVREVR